MKKHLLSSIICLISIAGFSQIVVDRSDMPVIGNMVVNAQDDINTVTPGNGGLNQTWDFSNLVATSYDSSVFIPVQQAPNYQYYPQANMAGYTLGMQDGFAYGFYEDSGTDIGIAGMDIQAILMPGFYMNMHISYLTSAWFHLPYHYGDTHTSTYTEVGYAAMYNNGIQLDTSKTVTHVTSQITVDGSGTLIIPTGSFPVLRVMETQQWVDSSFTLNGNTWVFESATPRSNLAYSWFGKNYGLIGKIQIDEGRATGMSFFVSETVVSVKTPLVKNNISISPNPVGDELFLNTTAKIDKIEIYDLNGSLKMVVSNSLHINTAWLNAGCYILKAYCKDGIATEKFVKQ